MGRTVCRAVVDHPGLALVAAINPSDAGADLAGFIDRPDAGVVVSSDLEALSAANAEVAVDFSTPSVVMDHVRWAVEHGMSLVVGTTGIGAEELEEIRSLLAGSGGAVGVVVASNFALGAVLLQRFAVEAARHLPAAEIIELHHDGKLDAPSGTARATAERMAAARKDAWSGPASESVPGVRGGDVEGIRVHSIRLPGLVAHQEVVFGGPGQTLTIRHDSMDRESFMPGVLLAIEAVKGRPGLTVGLEPLLGFAQDS
jgi:4-hydroxy-tetrahydrodipicolinate reductase